MFTTYVIFNENNKIYIGQTSDLEKRMKRHNGMLKSKKKSFTSKNKGIWSGIFGSFYFERKSGY